MLFKSDGFSDCYVDLIRHVYERPEFESAPRGLKIRECLGVKFQILNPLDRLLYVPGRNFSMTYTIAEALWYLLGENDTAWIANYANFWTNITDDGSTANSAYGARIFKPHPRIDNGHQTQWDLAFNELKRDSDSRRAVIHIHTPEDSRSAVKDVPCTLSIQFLIRCNQLHMIVNMRSSDLILGITYDIPAFTLFQELMALELGVGIGTYTHISNSLHIYERDFKMCEEILDSGRTTGPEMPRMSSEPNVKWLNGLQWLARTSMSDDELTQLYSNALTTCIDEYTLDWAKILLAHRAGKLGLQDRKIEYLKSTKFSGYHQFLR